MIVIDPSSARGEGKRGGLTFLNRRFANRTIRMIFLSKWGVSGYTDIHVQTRVERRSVQPKKGQNLEKTAPSRLSREHGIGGIDSFRQQGGKETGDKRARKEKGSIKGKRRDKSAKNLRRAVSTTGECLRKTTGFYREHGRNWTGAMQGLL